MQLKEKISFESRPLNTGKLLTLDSKSHNDKDAFKNLRPLHNKLNHTKSIIQYTPYAKCRSYDHATQIRLSLSIFNYPYRG